MPHCSRYDRVCDSKSPASMRAPCAQNEAIRRMNSLGDPAISTLYCVTYLTAVLQRTMSLSPRSPGPSRPQHAASDNPDRVTSPSSIGVRPATTRRRVLFPEPLQRRRWNRTKKRESQGGRVSYLGPVTIPTSPSWKEAFRLLQRTRRCSWCGWARLLPEENEGNACNDFAELS